MLAIFVWLVVDRLPFEVNETGWGEFEIAIKIHFVDSQEKPLTFFHQLQLYPKDELHPQLGKKVVSDHFEVLVKIETKPEQELSFYYLFIYFILFLVILVGGNTKLPYFIF